MTEPTGRLSLYNSGGDFNKGEIEPPIWLATFLPFFQLFSFKFQSHTSKFFLLYLEMICGLIKDCLSSPGKKLLLIS